MSTTRALTPGDPGSTCTRYEVTVTGHLDDRWSDWLGDLALIRNDDTTTTLCLDGDDQAQLHGVLTRLRDLGVTLLAVRQTDAPAGGITVETSSSSTEAQAAPHALDRALHTERLTLRPATADDTAATWAYRRLESVNEWLSGALTSLEEYRTQFVEPDRLSATVIVELRGHLGGGVVGDFMLRREDAWAQTGITDRAHGAQAELGWVLDPAYTGSGFATEAVRELLRYCFDELGVHRVVANCFLGNDASWRLMERVGMRRETPRSPGVTPPLRPLARHRRLRTPRRRVDQRG